MLTNEIKLKIESVYNNHFLGNSLSFSEEEKSLIYDEAGSILRRVGSEWGESIRRSEYEVILIALVELTKEWGSDEDAWLEFISKKLLGSQSDIRGKIYTQICKCMDSLNRDNRFFMLNCFTKRYYASVCSHAFAPKSSVFSFFDMCWEIYCKDLLQQYAPNDPILKLIASSLQKKLSDLGADENDISIASNVYAFRAGIKGLAIDQPELLIELLNTSLCVIHSLMNSEPIETDSYLKTLLREWWNLKEQSFGVKVERNIAKREYVATDYSQIKSKYVLDNGSVKLIVSPFRLSDNYEYEPYIQLIVNGKTVENKPIPTRGSGIILTTKTVEFDLEKLPLDGNVQISVDITHGSKVIYQSANNLHRDYILFSGNKELSSSSLLPGTYFIFAPKINDLELPCDIHRITKNLYSFTAEEGEVVRSKDKIVFFETEKTKREILFSVSERHDVYYRQDGVVYKIIDGDLCLDISEDSEITDFGVRHGTNVFKLSDFRVIDYNGKKRFIVSMLAEPGEAVSISVFKYSTNHIVESDNIIKFDNISIEYDKPIYYGSDSTGKFTFKTMRFCVEAVFDASEDENTVAFNDGEIIFIPPKLRWRFDDGEWNTKPSKPFFFKKITNSSMLEIDMPIDKDCIVGFSNGNTIEQANGKRLYKVGQTIHSLDNSIVDDVTLFLRSGDLLFEIAQIFLKQKFVSSPVYVKSEEYKIEWSPDAFIGEEDATLKMQIIKRDNGNVADERILQRQSNETIDVCFLSEDYYIIRIFLPSKGFLHKEIELFELNCVFGNVKNIRFRNKILKVTSAMFFDKIQSEQIRPIYFDRVEYLGNKEGSDYYSGNLFIIKAGGERVYLHHMRNYQTDSYIKINPVRIELKSLSSCYLGYGLDKNDPDWEYDDEFVVSYDGKTTIGNKGTKYRNVDFYLFEEHEEGEINV